MFLVLTAAMGVRDADVALAIAQLDNAEAPRRLSDCAVEIRFRGALPNIALVISGVDANIIPAKNRLKKLLMADMDSTIIPVECIDELADFAGVKDKVSEITEQAMRGELGFEASVDARVLLLKGLPEATLQQCFEQRISLNPGAKTLVKTMNSLGMMTALVSGGFTYFTEKIAVEAEFQMNKANVLEIENATLTGKVRRPILGRKAKQHTLNMLCRQHNISAPDVIGVGDGANDLDMIKAAGIGVAYRAKPALKAQANAVLDHSDLTALLALQGISQADYVS